MANPRYRSPNQYSKIRTQNKNDLRLGITELARGAIHLSYERSINNYRNGILASYELTYVNKTNEEI